MFGVFDYDPLAQALGQPDMGALVRRALAGLAGPNAPLAGRLAQALKNIPLGSGVWTRMLQGKTTPEDRQAVVTAVGTDLTPDVRDGLLEELARNFIGGGGPSASSGIDIGAMGGLNAVRGATIGSPQATPASAAPPTAASFGPNPPSAMPGIDPIAPQPGLPFQGNTGPLRVSVQKGVISFDQDGNPIQGTTNVLLKPDGSIFGTYDANLGKWVMTVPTTEENLAYAASSGYFSQNDLDAYRTTTSKLVSDAATSAIARARAGLDRSALELSNAVLEDTLTLAEATKQYRIHTAEYTARLTEIQMEQAAIELTFAPLTKKEKELSITQHEMQISQAREKFPLELATLREQLASAQAARQAQERAASQTEADNVYARGMFGGMLGVLAPGPGGSVASNPTGAPTPAAPSTGGPPPIYGQLAKGAGADPNDPSAQLAYALMQQEAMGQGGQQQQPPAQPGGA